MNQNSIFDSGADWLVNPVNAYGVHGAGLAKEFARRYPEAAAEYTARCRAPLSLVSAGSIFVVSVIGNSEPPVQKICFFATKQHWKDKSKIEYIEAGLSTLKDYMNSEETSKTIAFPAIGCGLGGLDWNQVKPLLIEFRNQVELMNWKVLIFDPL